MKKTSTVKLIMKGFCLGEDSKWLLLKKMMNIYECICIDKIAYLYKVLYKELRKLI